MAEVRRWLRHPCHVRGDTKAFRRRRLAHRLLALVRTAQTREGDKAAKQRRCRRSQCQPSDFDPGAHGYRCSRRRLLDGSVTFLTRRMLSQNVPSCFVNVLARALYLVRATQARRASSNKQSLLCCCVLKRLWICCHRVAGCAFSSIPSFLFL